MLRKEDSFADDFPLVRVVLPALIVIAEKPAAALVSRCRDSGPVLAPLNNADIKIRTRHIYSPPFKRKGLPLMAASQL